MNSKSLSASISGSKLIDLELRDMKKDSVIFDSGRSLYVLETKLFNGENGSIFKGEQGQNMSFPRFAGCIPN